MLPKIRRTLRFAFYFANRMIAQQLPQVNSTR